MIAEIKTNTLDRYSIVISTCGIASVSGLEVFNIKFQFSNSNIWGRIPLILRPQSTSHLPLEKSCIRPCKHFSSGQAAEG